MPKLSHQVYHDYYQRERVDEEQLKVPIAKSSKQKELALDIGVQELRGILDWKSVLLSEIVDYYGYLESN